MLEESSCLVASMRVLGPHRSLDFILWATENQQRSAKHTHQTVLPGDSGRRMNGVSSDRNLET